MSNSSPARVVTRPSSASGAVPSSTGDGVTTPRARVLGDEDKAETFEVTIVAKPKHTLLYELAKQLGGIRRLAAEVGVSAHTMSSWVNLRSMPRYGGRASGPWTQQRLDAVLLKLVQMTRQPIEAIFPGFVRKRLEDIPREVEFTREISTVSLASEHDRAALLPSPEQAAENDELRARFGQLLKTLSYREREIIKLRYGLDDGYGYTLEEVGHIFKVTRERIRSIEAAAIRKLQQSSRADELTDFIDVEIEGPERFTPADWAKYERGCFEHTKE